VTSGANQTAGVPARAALVPPKFKLNLKDLRAGTPLQRQPFPPGNDPVCRV
jgi:hypothetical protein